MAYTTGTATGHEDLLEKFRVWVTGYGTATTPDGTGNTGNGTCSAVTTSTRTKTESWTVTCVVDTGSGNETWDVTGSVSGLQTAQATTGVEYTSDDGSVRFTITDGATDFVNGDEWTFSTTAGAMNTGEATTPVADGGNTGNGTMGAVTTGPTTTSELWTVTCNDDAVSGSEVFSVTGSVSGLQTAEATAGVLYVSDNGEVVFTITAGGTDFVVGDEFTFETTAPTPWCNQRRIERAAWTRSGTTATLVWPGHNFAVNDTFVVTESSSTGAITNATKTVATVSGDNITFTCLNAGATSGYLTGTATWDSQVLATTWSRSTGTATVTWNSNSVAVGDTITISASSDTGVITNGTKTVTAVATNTISFACTASGATSGTCTVTLNETHLYLKGRGNANADEIFVQLRSYQNAAGGYHNIELRGASGFSASAGTTRTTQAGISALHDLCLWSSSMPYWFIANGRRFMIIAKVGTIYQSSYAGLILPTGLPSEYTYPLAVGACRGTTRQLYSSTSGAHRAFWNTNESLQLLDKVGTWRSFTNYNSSETAMWSGNSLLRTFPFGGSVSISTYMGNPFWPNIDGTYSLFPASMVGKYTVGSDVYRNIFGDLDGVYCVSGYLNASENIVQASGVDHLVVQNVFRTNAAEYAAFALE